MSYIIPEEAEADVIKRVWGLTGLEDLIRLLLGPTDDSPGNLYRAGSKKEKEAPTEADASPVS